MKQIRKCVPFLSLRAQPFECSISSLLLSCLSARRKPVEPVKPREPAAPRLDVCAPHLNEQLADAWNRTETFPDVVLIDHADAFFVHHVSARRRKERREVENLPIRGRRREEGRKRNLETRISILFAILTVLFQVILSSIMPLWKSHAIQQQCTRPLSAEELAPHSATLAAQ